MFYSVLQLPFLLTLPEWMWNKAPIILKYALNLFSVLTLGRPLTGRCLEKREAPNLQLFVAVAPGNEAVAFCQ
jgi:hypothetical protein